MFAEGVRDESKYIPAAQRGIVFLSSIPTDMRANEVRLHLQQFGEIFRTKFTAFPKKERPGSKRLLPLQFKNGYVEFMKKEDAITCATVLNGQMVATKKRRKSHGQLWSLRYMEDFSWGELAEEREEKMRHRKETEFRSKESERSSNEMFRKMVMMKKQQEEKKAQARAKEKKAADEAAVVATTSSTQAANAHQEGDSLLRRAKKSSKRDRTEAQASAPSVEVVKPKKKLRLEGDKKKDNPVVKAKRSDLRARPA